MGRALRRKTRAVSPIRTRPIGGDGVADVVKNAGRYNVATDAKSRGTKIHVQGVKFEQISTSEFCVSCHQVAVNLGIKLEVVWDQYRASPARAQGITGPLNLVITGTATPLAQKQLAKLGWSVQQQAFN